MDPTVRQAIDAIGRRDWAALRPLLHPYLHWTDGPARLRGRTNVLARLAAHPDADPPASCELRDGQIYRWTA